MEIRVGNGYDLHRLVRNRKMILGNVEIPFHKGFLAHSDGDLLIHAIIDALLGASNLGDIGQLFPDTDLQFKNINSAVLLKQTMALIKANNFYIINIDATIVCEKPKLKTFIPLMRIKIAEILMIGEDRISIKAKTKEKVDAVGKGKAAECYVTCLIKSMKENISPA